MKKITEFLILIIVSTLAFSAPEPKKVQPLDDWTLDVKVNKPRQIVVEGQYYWYIIMSVTNNTGKDVGFYPEANLMTDTFKITPAGLGISDNVFKQIKTRHNIKYPFLERMAKTDHRMLQGENNMKDLAVIWRDFDPRAKKIKLFITGLSDETAVVKHPTKKDENGEPVKIYLRKTLELVYSVAGDPQYRSRTKLEFKEKDWIMR